MYSGPPTDRIEEGRQTAYGYEITYAIDLLYYGRTHRRVSAWVETSNGETFFTEKYKMEPGLLDKLLGRTRPVPEEEHRDEVLDRAQAYAKRLAKKRADALGEEFEEPKLITGVSTRHE